MSFRPFPQPTPLAPIHFASGVQFEPVASPQKKAASQTITGPTPKTKTTTRTRRVNEKRQWTVKARNVVEREELINREQVIQLTTEFTLDGNKSVPGTPDSTAPSVAHISETEVRKLEVGGVPIESSEFTRTRIAYIASAEGADDFFSREERKEAENVLEAARRPYQRLRRFAIRCVGHFGKASEGSA